MTELLLGLKAVSTAAATTKLLAVKHAAAIGGVKATAGVMDRHFTGGSSDGCLPTGQGWVGPSSSSTMHHHHHVGWPEIAQDPVPRVPGCWGPFPHLPASLETGVGGWSHTDVGTFATPTPPAPTWSISGDVHTTPTGSQTASAQVEYHPSPNVEVYGQVQRTMPGDTSYGVGGRVTIP